MQPGFSLLEKVSELARLWSLTLPCFDRRSPTKQNSRIIFLWGAAVQNLVEALREIHAQRTGRCAD
jgi:hypothetical protein